MADLVQNLEDRFSRDVAQLLFKSGEKCVCVCVCVGGGGQVILLVVSGGGGGVKSIYIFFGGGQAKFG